MIRPADLVIALVLGTAGLCHGQWTLYSPANTAGTADAQVRGIAATSAKIWFATSTGLKSRDNATGIWTSHSIGGVEQNALQCVHAASYIKLVLGTDHGVVVWNSSSGSTQVWVGDDFPGSFVRGVVATSSTNYWAATFGTGLLQYVGNEWVAHTMATGLPTNFYHCVQIDADGALWFGTSDHGVLKLHNGNWSQYTTADGLAGNTVRSVVQDAWGRIWLAGSGGLSVLEGGVWQTRNTGTGAHSDLYLSLALGPDSTVWAGGEHGIDVFTNGVLTDHQHTATGMLHDLTGSLARDADGNMWCAYAEMNASALIDGMWLHYGQGHGMPYNINCVTELMQGVMAFGHSTGITTFNDAVWTGQLDLNYTVRYFERPLQGDEVYARFSNGFLDWSGSGWSGHSNIPGSGKMAVADDGVTWFCTDNGLVKRSVTGALTTIPKAYTLDRNPTDVAVAPNGHVWALTSSGLCLYEGTHWIGLPFAAEYEYIQPYSLNIGPDSRPVFVALNTLTDQLKVYKQKGLYKVLNVIDLIDAETPWQLSSPKIYGSYFDSHGDLWLVGGAYSGNSHPRKPVCVVLRAGEEPVFYNDLNLPGGYLNFAYDITESSTGEMWLVADNGVYRFDPTAVGVRAGPERSESGLVAHPNPSNGDVLVQINEAPANEVLEVLDMHGRVVTRHCFQNPPGAAATATLQIHGLPQGLYLLRSASDNRTFRLIKQ